MGNPYFRVFKGEDEQWYFSLVAANGEVVASGEGYASHQGALDGVEAVRRAAAAADVKDEKA